LALGLAFGKSSLLKNLFQPKAIGAVKSSQQTSKPNYCGVKITAFNAA
jgi:hypothetical protein